MKRALATRAAVGGLVVAAGLAANRWSLGALLSADGQIENPGYRAAILAAQLALICVGLALVAWRGSQPARGWWVLAPPALAVLGVGVYGSLRGVLPETDDQRLVRAMEDSEKVYLAVTPRLDLLKKSALNLALPDHFSLPLFADSVALQDGQLQPTGASERLDASGVELEAWHVAAGSATQKRDALTLWPALFSRIVYLREAKFYVWKARFDDETRKRWKTLMGFQGLARLASGEEAQLTAKMDVVWSHDPNRPLDEAESWRISEWHTKELKLARVERPLFAETLGATLADKATLTRARTSIHDQHVVRHFRDKVAPDEFFTYQAFDRHPGVAVTDLDGDGLDDFYLMPLWGRNMFFRNQGDGTFREIAAELGLDLENHTSSALFADFDNDGDKDVFLGRTLLPSVYLANEGGRFVDRSKQRVSAPLPALVSSVSAADFNGDGLLDVYFATYAAEMFETHANAPERFLPPEQAREYRSRAARSHWLQGRVGPPNLLLENTGAGFQPAQANATVQVWRNSYQASFADYDRDGRPDLYVANDFSRNTLFHNEGGGRFKDVTEQTGTADVGFGMGASWGDYDNDGRPDLYVSNMFSKAGQRITEMIGQRGQEFREMARGNTLFRNCGARFERVSGLEPPALAVEMAGWSWGSQFVDVDNDGLLDVYALSGYYTAPKEISLPVDT